MVRSWDWSQGGWEVIRCLWSGYQQTGSSSPLCRANSTLIFLKKKILDEGLLNTSTPLLTINMKTVIKCHRNSKTINSYYHIQGGVWLIQHMRPGWTAAEPVSLSRNFTGTHFPLGRPWLCSCKQTVDRAYWISQDESILWGWCKSNCGFTPLNFAVWCWNILLNKCGYAIHIFNVHFSPFLLMIYYLLCILYLF